MKPAGNHQPTSFAFALLLLPVLVLIDCVSFWLFDGRMINGPIQAGISTPYTVRFFDLLHQGVYPFFDFNMQLGLDTLAESQGSVGHPVKWILALIMQDPWALDTAFEITHMAMLLVALFVLFKPAKGWHDGRGLVGAAAGSAFYVGSLSLYLNYCHPMFISVLAYHPLIHRAIDRWFDRPTPTRLAVLASWMALMLLCGNYALQFVVLVSALVHWLTWVILLKRRPLPHLFAFATAVAVAFALASYQILPSLDLMLQTERASLGGIHRFVQSLSPVQILSYVNPAALSQLFKNAGLALALWSGPGPFEGVHYIGIVPVALVIARLRAGRFTPAMWSCIIVMLFMFLRALGVFSLLNLGLNMLPFFGQFRFPIRSLHIVDIMLCVLAAQALVDFKMIPRNVLSRALAVCTMASAGFALFAVAESFFGSTAARTAEGVMNSAELLWLLLPIVVGILAWLLVRAGTNRVPIPGRVAVMLLLLGLGEVGLHRRCTPKVWTTPTVEVMAQKARLIDKACADAGVPNFWYPKGWPLSNVPIHPLSSISSHDPRDGSTPFVAASEYSDLYEFPNGRTCVANLGLTAGTLTAGARYLFRDRLTGGGYPFQQQLDLLAMAGIQAIADGAALLPEELSAGAKPFQLLKINVPAANGDVVRTIEAIAGSPLGLLTRFTEPLYGWMRQHDLVHLLPQTTVVMPAAGAPYVPFGPFGYLHIESELGKTISYSGQGLFFRLAESPGTFARVTHVPVAFVFGAVLSLASVLVLLIALLILTHWRNVLWSPSPFMTTSTQRLPVWIQRTGRFVMTDRFQKTTLWLSLAGVAAAVVIIFNMKIAAAVPTNVLVASLAMLPMTVGLLYLLLRGVFQLKPQLLSTWLAFASLSYTIGYMIWVNFIIP